LDVAVVPLILRNTYLGLSTDLTIVSDRFLRCNRPPCPGSYIVKLLLNQGVYR